MIPPLDLPRFNKDLESWLAEMEGIESRLADPQRRLEMRQAIEQVREGQKVVNAEYAREIQSIAARTAAVEKQNAETTARLAKLRAEVADSLAARPEPAATTPLVSDDRQLGDLLRREMLARYAQPQAPTRPDDAISEGSVAKYWEGSESSESSVSGAEEEKGGSPTAPGDKERPKKRPGDELWEDLSREEK